MWNDFVTSIFDYAINNNASDIHISDWVMVTYRIDWVLKTVESFWEIDLPKIREILVILLKSNKENINKFLTNYDLDFAYVHDAKNSFRVNAFLRLWKILLLWEKYQMR